MSAMSWEGIRRESLSALLITALKRHIARSGELFLIIGGLSGAFPEDPNRLGIVRRHQEDADQSKDHDEIHERVPTKQSVLSPIIIAARRALGHGIVPQISMSALRACKKFGTCPHGQRLTRSPSGRRAVGLRQSFRRPRLLAGRRDIRRLAMGPLLGRFDRVTEQV